MQRPARRADAPGHGARVPVVTAALVTGLLLASPLRSAEPCPADLQARRGRTDALTCACDARAASGGGSVWGTGVYTDDSALCRAALHAGAVGPDGGTVTVRGLPGQSSYSGSSRNGVASVDYGAWKGSYRFDGARGDLGLPPPTTATGAPTGPSSPTPAGIAPCPPKLTALRGTGRSLTCTCAEGASGAVWGTDVYTDDSSPCVAARHAGALAGATGTITVRMTDGQPAYEGSSRHGVSTTGYGSWHGSFYFPDISPAPPPTPMPSPVTSSSSAPATIGARAPTFDAGDAGLASAFLTAVGTAALVVSLAVILLMVASLWRIFTKAGEAGWAAVIPIYNVVVLARIVGRPPWWIALYFLPPINLFAWLADVVELARCFRRSGAFAAGLIFLPFVFYPVLAFDASQYEGPFH